MANKIYLFLVIILLGLALACGAGGGQAPQNFAIAATETERGQTPTVQIQATEAANLEERPGSATETPPSTEMPASTRISTMTPTAEPVVSYTSDGNPCQRPVGGRFSQSVGGTTPVKVDVGDVGEAVISRLDHLSIDFAAFIYPDGRQIVTHSEPFPFGDGDIRIWDTATGEEQAHVERDGNYAFVAVGGRASLLAAATTSGDMWAWDLENIGSGDALLNFGTNKIGSFTISPDGRYLAFADTGTDMELGGLWGIARLFDLETGQEIQRFEGELVPEVDPDSGSVIGLSMLNGHAAPIKWLGFSPNGLALLTLSYNEFGRDGTMRLWDIATGQQLRCFEIDSDEGANGAAFSPNGREIATASNDGILIWDTETSQSTRRLGLFPEISQEINAVAYSPDGTKIIASSLAAQAAQVWDQASGQLVGLLRHPELVGRADISADGRYIVTLLPPQLNGYPGAAWVWDANHSSLNLAAAAQNLVSEGLALGEQGDIGSMLNALNEAQNISPDDNVLLRPDVWQLACRYGSFAGQPAEVLAACDAAIKIAADLEYSTFALGGYHDSRGLARALSGDTPGAIEDFQFFVDASPFDSRVPKRQSWIADLSVGQNPFDEATLAALREE